MKDLNFFHESLIFVVGYVVAHFIWLQQKNQHASGKILQSSAKGHTYCHTGRCKDGNERACLDAQDAYNRYNQNEHQRYFNEAQRERSERLINVTLDHNAVQYGMYFIDYEFADIEYDDSGHNSHSKSRNRRGKLV